MSHLRSMKKFASVAAYLRAVPPAPRAALQQLRKTRIAENERRR
jgi:hypothetical protein